MSRLPACEQAPAFALPRVETRNLPWVRIASVAAVVLLTFTVWALRMRGPIDLRYDASVYYVLGTSLATGQGYRLLNEPGQPEGVQYPPLLPALVAAEQRLLGTTDLAVVAPWLRATYAALYLAYGLCVLALARAHLRPWPALAATAVCVAHTNTILYSDLLFTELPFSVVAVGFALLLATRRLSSHPRLREVLTFLLAAAGFLLRTAGIALLAAWVGEAALRRRWRTAAWRALAALLPVVAWQAHVWRVKHSDGYLHPTYAYQRAAYQFYNVPYGENLALADPFRPEEGKATFGTVAKRVAFNLAVMPSAIGEAVSTSNGFWRWLARLEREGSHNRYEFSHQVARAPLIVLAGLVAVGVVLLIRRHAWNLVLVLLGSIALVCTTPWAEQFARYLTPPAPFLAIAAMIGGAALYRHACRHRGWGAIAARYGLVVLALMVTSVQVFALQIVFRQRHYESSTYKPGQGIDSHRLFYYEAPWVAWERATRWIAARAAPGDVVATTSPHLLFLRTGLRSVMPPMEADPARALALLDDVPASWVIVDDLSFLDISRFYALPAVASDPARWRLAQQFGATKIFERVRPPLTGAGPGGSR